METTAEVIMIVCNVLITLSVVIMAVRLILAINDEKKKRTIDWSSPALKELQLKIGRLAENIKITDFVPHNKQAIAEGAKVLVSQDNKNWYHRHFYKWDTGFIGTRKALVYAEGRSSWTAHDKHEDQYRLHELWMYCREADE